LIIRDGLESAEKCEKYSVLSGEIDLIEDIKTV